MNKRFVLSKMFQWTTSNVNLYEMENKQKNSLEHFILFVKNVMGNFANKNLKWVSDIMTSKNQAIFNNAATRWR